MWWLFMNLETIFMWICIVIVLIFSYRYDKKEKQDMEDAVYDASKRNKKSYCKPHLGGLTGFSFAELMIAIGSAIYIAIALSLASSQDRRSYKRGIECCNQNNGTIDGYYCKFNYRNEVSIRDLDNETSLEYKAYCLKDEESLKELRPYDWQKYVDE